MKLVMEVLTERENEFNSKSRGHVKERVITFMDKEKHLGHQCYNTFDYVLSDEESRAYAPGGLDAKQVEVGISDVRFWQGRIQFRGKLGSVLNGKAVGAK
jgi:hypothetical protein